MFGQLIAWFQGHFRTKWQLFGVLVFGVAVIAGVISLIAYSTFLNKTSQSAVKIAVIAPLSGSQQQLGQAIVGGVQIFADQANKRHGIGGHPVEVLTIDDGSDPVKAAQAAEVAAKDPDVISVIGHYDAPAAAAAAKVYEMRRLPALSLAAPLTAPDATQPWSFQMTADQTFEIKFLTNYVRNVVGEKLITIVYAAGPANESLANTFDEVLQRYGTRVLFKMPVDFSTGHAEASLKAIADDMKDKKLIGGIVVLGDAEQSALTVAALRQASIKNAIFGTHTLATDAFKQRFAELWKGPSSVGAALSGTLMTAPMLFDTAGADAQDFRAAFAQSYGSNPDWLAAMSFNAAQLVAQGFADAKGQKDTVTPQLRASIRDQLAAYNSVAHAVPGINGPIFFDRGGGATSPIMIGAFDGADLIAAMTQLSPIREEGVDNYLQELTAGRALYVNDRFMYKTNVIYSGIRTESISGIDTTANTADLEMVVWFRWRGSFEPQDIVFSNAVTPIKLENPERQSTTDDINYRAYRVKGKFFLNFSSLAHPYGTKLVGLTFRHRTLGRNNVMYVSDILGMGLAGDKTLTEELHDGGVLAGQSGWLVDHALLSEELASAGTDGDPTYVGFGRPSPDFSTLNLSIIVKPDVLDPTSYVPKSWLIYIAIFAFAGAVLASILDRKDRGQFWRIQTLLLRLVTWPLLLVAVGTMTLDYASQNWTTSATDRVLFAYHILWWVIPARLADFAMERFVWVPLEIHSSRKVPNVVRHMTMFVIYVLAMFGIVAFVMGQTITSLLATSGLLAMIIGLAIQSNLKDVFSGIFLNIERPFSIGDIVEIGKTTGEVTDITWRTTRIRSRDGQQVSFPNGEVSEAEIHNLSRSAFVRREVAILLDPRYDPRMVLPIIHQCLFEDHGGLIPKGTEGARVWYAGVDWADAGWVSKYVILLELRDRAEIRRVLGMLWERLWPKLTAAGICWESADSLSGNQMGMENLPPMLEHGLG